MPSLIFLDFDDVLAISREYSSFQVLQMFKHENLDDWPELWRHVFFAEACRNLAVLHEQFQPEYVISSSWTHYLSREQIIEVLRRTELDFVAQSLHQQWTTPKSVEPRSRLAEIEAWLTENCGTSHPILILDDEQSGASLAGSALQAQGKVVLCKPWRGLTDEKREEASALLQRQG